MLVNNWGSQLTPLQRYRQIAGNLSPAAWFRFNEGITVTGAGVSQWDDQSGNARHLLQATDTNRPSLEADGSILFDGVDNYLKTGAFTLNQPCTVYWLGQQVTWTVDEYLWDGDGQNNCGIRQHGASPRIRMNAGSEGPITAVATPALGAYSVVAALYNGASSEVQVNLGVAQTGDVGANAMSGFTVGARGDANALTFSNIQAKEVILYAAAHDATTRASVINYLALVGGIAV